MLSKDKYFFTANYWVLNGSEAKDKVFFEGLNSSVKVHHDHLGCIYTRTKANFMNGLEDRVCKEISCT